ncbi:hypothetical protein [Streptacidiphilus fuscans]|uniref:Uncharacterized protein n=1 Tax=Streptacidiphilus fuscans TaxID=2789292 RepID=A0A931B049_9ACTN|nr:hypothetical protein [Streptacidiphilus fuscans]MBF9066481.1 hypothetical protein [Streptacidiphilus fuscans]
MTVLEFVASKDPDAVKGGNSESQLIYPAGLLILVPSLGTCPTSCLRGSHYSTSPERMNSGAGFFRIGVTSLACCTPDGRKAAGVRLMHVTGPADPMAVIVIDPGSCCRPSATTIE